MFHTIVTKLIDSEYPLPKGGEPIRRIRTSLQLLEKKYGSLTAKRIVDYVVSSLYVFRDKKGSFQLKSVFGPKSIERFTTNKAHTYYEDKWLASGGINRLFLIDIITDKSKHPKSKFIFMQNEEGTKKRLLNIKLGFSVCQSLTLGWSPLSESCSQCIFVEKCKTETLRKFPEIFRLRIEYGNKQ